MKIRPSLIAALLGAAAAAAACQDANDSGHVRATAIGQRADINAPRVAAGDLGGREACGPVTGRGLSELIRFPYLQQVTDRSAQVLWASGNGDAYTVAVKSVDGDSVGSFTSSVDQGGAVAGGGSQHVAQLEGLEPDHVYCYSIKGPRGEVLGPTGFRTAPGPGAKIAFAAFGDSGGGGADQEAVIGQLKTVAADFMLVTGDIAYDSGTLQQFEDKFFAMYEPLLASIPLFPTSGNHDYQTDDARPYRQVFSLPENGGENGRERWYSFDWGDAHFVALDTEKVNDEQAAWLEQDLERNEKPWTIVFAHKGPYASGAHGSSEAFRNRFSPILEAHGSWC
jgi:acid phosphatase type 7